MKVVVSHPEQQHSYRLATALKEAGFFEKYITTVYYKKKNLTYWAARVLRGNQKKKAQARHCKDLQDYDVIQYNEFLGILKLFFMRYSITRRFYEKFREFTADRFAINVARYAMKNHVDAVVTYDTCSPVLFRILKKKAPNIIRIMDMSAANLLYLKEIYDKDMNLAPSFSDQLRNARGIVWDKRSLSRVMEEINDTHYFLIPSGFVRRSLHYSGISDEQMLSIPYGVDVDKFSQKQYKDAIHDPVEFIYVGGVTEHKGISYLLEAFKEIDEDKAHLTVLGSNSLPETIAKSYNGKIRFTGRILHDKVAELLKNADVFVFPSLGDSYSLAAMEAAACGLPLIVTENTGMSDLITEGEEGFVIPIQSAEAIKDKVMWFVNNKASISLMGEKARRMAERNTWKEYNASVKKAFDIIASRTSQKTPVMNDCK